jgi:hypothetical protein
MRRCLVATCLLALPVCGRGDEPVAEWSEASRLFEIARTKLEAGQPARESFRRAASAWARAVDTAHPESFLNRGNAHYLAGELPEAIAAYQAGLNIDPSNSRLHTNLALARQDVALPHDSALIQPAPIWQRYAFQRWLVWPGLVIWLAACAVLPASLRLGSRRGIAIGVVLTTLAASAGAAGLIRTSYLTDIDQRPVCVVRLDTPLRTGNADRYASHPDAPLLPRGYEVRRIGKRGEWLHVECPGGQIGWVPAGNVIP